MTEELLSIVVPVYNVRDYLDECISSILDQTYRNFELILVVNGPTDGSDDICKRYAQKDQRIKLITIEKNRGVLPAWISGVNAASGEYLGFVDADDYIDPDLYRQLMECKEDFDLVISRWKREEGDRTRVRSDPLAAGAYRTPEDMEFILEHIFCSVEPGGGEHLKPGIAPFIWKALFKTSLAKKEFNKIVENIPICGDLVFTCLYILVCKSVLVTDICGYHYRIRKTSNCHGIDFDRYMTDVEGVYHTLQPAFMAHPCRDLLIPQLQQKVATLLSKAPRKMAFDQTSWDRTVVFPFLNLLNGKNIALYGADEIGQAYRRQIRRYGMCEVDLWVDEKWEYRRREGWNVSPVDALAARAYDYVVIAARHQDTAETIRKDLISMGVEEDKILWKAPVELS